MAEIRTMDALNDRQERKRHWEAVYRQKRFDETSWHQANPGWSLAMIEQTGAGPETPVIDIGGGASLLVDHLLEQGFQDVTVLDISAAAIAQARARLSDRPNQPNWIEADVTHFRPTRRYGVWHDRAAFHFLTSPRDRRRYVRALEQALAPQGQAVIATFDPKGPKRCSGLEVLRYEAQDIEKALGPAFRLLDQREDLHVTPAGREQHFNFFRFLRK